MGFSGFSEWLFLGFSFTTLNIDLADFSLSFITTVTKKTLFSRNIDEVIRAVLNPLLFFYEKISHAPKPSKAPKGPKAQKTQKHNRPKVKNATRKQK